MLFPCIPLQVKSSGRYVAVIMPRTDTSTGPLTKGLIQIQPFLKFNLRSDNLGSNSLAKVAVGIGFSSLSWGTLHELGRSMPAVKPFLYLDASKMINLEMAGRCRNEPVVVNLLQDCQWCPLAPLGRSHDVFASAVDTHILSELNCGQVREDDHQCEECTE